jgi:hypothetical protein
MTGAPVRAIRVGVASGVLAAVYLLVVFLVHPVPGRLVAVFGGPKSEVERHGGLRLLWRPPAGFDVGTLEQRFAARESGVMLRRDGNSIVVEVPHVKRDDVAEVSRMIAGSGGLEFHEVVESTELAKLETMLGIPTRGDGVALGTDQWRTETGEAYVASFLRAPTREALTATLADATARGWHPASGTHLAFEHVIDAAPDQRSESWRTYPLADEVALDGDAIVSAQAKLNEYDHRPIVLVAFDRAGAEKFAALTERLRGHKLAIVVGDVVQSAPVIQDVIRGGRISITMGGSDPARADRDAHTLATTLGAGTLPRGGEITASIYVPGADSAPMEWLGRLTVVLAGGALFGLLAWMLVRATRPVWRPAPARGDGAFPLGRLAVWLIAPVALLLASRLPIPGVDVDALRAAAGPGASKLVNLGMLGVMPILTAYVVIELVAVIVPGWRRRRHGGPDARRPIGRAVAGLALAFTLIQGWTISVYLQSMSGFDEVLPFGRGHQLEVMAALGVATLGFVAVAQLVREHGLGNGYGALLAGAWLIAAGGHWFDEPLLSTSRVVTAVTIVAIALPVACVLRWRVGALGEAALRVPSSGIGPLGDAGGLVVLVVLLARFPWDRATSQVAEWTTEIHARRWLVLVLVAAMTIGWSLAFARPAGVGRIAERAGLARPGWPTWWRATAITAAVLLAVSVVAMTTGAIRGDAMWLADPVTIAIVTAVALDAYDDARARRVALELVWTLHHPQHVDAATRALDDAGIPHVVSASGLRTLFAWFGPFVPIDVRVPPEHAPAARERLAGMFAIDQREVS